MSEPRYRHPVEIAAAAVKENPWALEPGDPPRRPRWWHPMDGLRVLAWVFWRPDRLWWWISDEMRAVGVVDRWWRRAWIAGGLAVRALTPVVPWAVGVGVLTQLSGLAFGGSGGAEILHALPSAAGAWTIFAVSYACIGVATSASTSLLPGIRAREFGVIYAIALVGSFEVFYFLCLPPLGLSSRPTERAFFAGLAGGCGTGVAGTTMVNATAGAVIAVMLSLVIGITLGPAAGVVAGVGGLVFATGLLASLCELVVSLAQTFHDRGVTPFFHPLAAVPHPDATRLLREDIDHEPRLPVLRWWLRNPYRRVQAQRVVGDRLEIPRQPVRTLLGWLANPTTQASLRLGSTFDRVDLWPASTLLDALLTCAHGELAVREIESDGTIADRLPTGESLAARLTQPFARKPTPALADFARGLRFLIHGVSLFDAPEPPAPHLLSLLQAAANLPDGAGLAEAYTALHHAGTLDDPNTLADFPYKGPRITHAMPDVAAATALRAAVSELQAVAAEVSATRLIASDVDRAARLAAAQRRLVELGEARPVDLLPHDRALLNEVARRWLNLLVARGDRLARLTPPTPAESHYLAGPFVPPERLVGRDALLADIDHTWSPRAPHGWPPLVLYGHRRMGKTSLLHALVPRFRDRAVVVVVSAQGLSWSEGRAAVCAGFALRLRSAARTEGVELRDASLADVTGWEQLVELIEEVHIASGRRVVLAIDELEALRADPPLLEQLRALHTEAWWFTPVLAGLHDLTDPWLGTTFTQLVADARQVPVGLLEPAQARALLLHPTPSADLAFEEDAAARILADAGGQPYLLQHLGDLVVREVNRRLAGGDSARVVTAEDVARVMGAPLFDDARAYFVGVWEQAIERPGADNVLRALAASQPAPRASLATDADAVFAHLLKVRVIREDCDGLRFEVPAVGRWIRARQAG